MLRSGVGERFRTPRLTHTATYPLNGITNSTNNGGFKIAGNPDAVIVIMIITVASTPTVVVCAEFNGWIAECNGWIVRAGPERVLDVAIHTDLILDVVNRGRANWRQLIACLFCVFDVAVAIVSIAIAIVR